MISKIFFLSSFLTLLMFSKLSAKENPETSIIGGYGYYESSFIGIKYSNLKNGQWLLGGGYNFHIDNMVYSSLFGEYQKGLLQKKILAGISLKVIYWQQSDEYLLMRNLGLNPNVFGEYRISNRFLIACSVGPIFNFNLYNERKSYEMTGWVKDIDVNFQVSIAYVLPFKK